MSITMYTYYKGYEKALVWRAVTSESRAQISEAEATYFTTILDVSERVNSASKGGSVSDSAVYAGPFYVDIDSDNIKSSIYALQKVMKKFAEFNVPATFLDIWASGMKGFHITLDFAKFTNGEPLTKLPWTYKQLAKSMGLSDILCVDKTVYSGGRGRMWRVENKQRKDNGKYKVRITPSEAQEMSVLKYDQLTSAPRTLPTAPHEQLVLFQRVFENARAKALTTEKPKMMFLDKGLLEHLKGELPPCAKDLMDWKNINDNSGFNDISLQFGKAAATFSGYDSDLHLKTFSDNAKGDNYNTPHKRLSHCKTAFTTARAGNQYEFSCASMLAVLESEPCFNCPIAFIRFPDEETEAKGKPKPKPKLLEAPKKDSAVEELSIIKGEQYYGNSDKPNETERVVGARINTDENIMASAPQADIYMANALSVYGKKRDLKAQGRIETNKYNIVETDEGYSIVEGKSVKQLTNFVLRFKNMFFQEIPNKKTDVRVSIEGQVYAPSMEEETLKPMGSFEIEETSWSRSGMISALSGVGNAAFFGNDDHMQKLKAVLMENADKVTNAIKKVPSFGIHRQEISTFEHGQPVTNYVMTYVEPGWSIDQYGNQNTYSYSKVPNAYPELKNIGLLNKGCEKTSEALRAMFKINDPHRIGLIVGWTMACFLKEHIFAFKPEFPLLSLNGEPGSGKTSTARIIGALHGVDYSTQFSPVNLRGSTEFAVWNFIGESKTVPRLLEEFNKSKLDKPGTYNGFVETFKSAYNNHAHTQGYLTNTRHYGGQQSGAAIISIPMTGPVVLCSEQAIADVALVERCLQCRFSTIKNSPEKLAAFTTLTPLLRDLKSFAKTAYGEALATPVSEIEARLKAMKNRVSSKIEKDRPRHCFETMFLGLDFLGRIIQKYKLDCMEEFTFMYQGLEAWLNKNKVEINKVKAKSEVDLIIDKLNSIAGSPTGNKRWEIDKVYILKENKLYLDSMAAHMLYVGYTNTTGRSQPAIESFLEFIALLETESYCMKDENDKPIRTVIPGFARGRRTYCLDTDKMISKGLDITGFEMSVEF